MKVNGKKCSSSFAESQHLLLLSLQCVQYIIGTRSVGSNNTFHQLVAISPFMNLSPISSLLIIFKLFPEILFFIYVLYKATIIQIGELFLILSIFWAFNIFMPTMK